MHPFRSGVGRVVLALALAGGLSGCGLGAAALGGGSGGGGSSSDATALRSLAVDDARTSPARISFVLVDRDADPAEVALLVIPAGGTLADAFAAQLAGAPDLSALATSPAGEAHAFDWDFAAQLASGAAFAPGWTLFVRVTGVLETPVLGTNALLFDVGNDAPSVVLVQAPPAVESTGNVELDFTIEDSSDDPVGVRVEYDVVGDAPDAGWRLARPAGLPASAPTPDFAFPQFPAAAGGAAGSFVWDSAHDLGTLELDVRLRFTADDGLVASAPLASASFRVDNNAAPGANLQNELVVANGDERRGIPVPFVLRDAEADAVEVVLQWRRPSQAFPTLPGTADELREVLADPEQRLQLQVGRERPGVRTGRTGVVPAGFDPLRTVALPGLATDAVALLSGGLEGRWLELFRPSGVPVEVAAGWTTNPLRAPIAALPLGDGLRALVLDRPAAQTWRLFELDLRSGVELRPVVAPSSGEPSALALERGDAHALVATHVAGAWRITRVELATGATQQVADSTLVGGELGAVRGIASLGRSTALLTQRSTLYEARFPSGGTRSVVPLVSGLTVPSGVAADPTFVGRAFVAEREALPEAGGPPGRILEIDLRTRLVRPLALIAAPGAPPFARPEALALEPGRSRLLAIGDADEADGRRELFAIPLGGPAASEATPVRLDLPPTTGALGVGAEGLRVVALPAGADLAIGGGLAARLALAAAGAHEPAAGLVRLADPLAAPVPAATPWRIATAPAARRTSPTGRPGTLVWDSSEVPGGGPVHLRLVPVDTDLGASDSGAVSKSVKSDLAASAPPAHLGNAAVAGGPLFAEDVVSADLDGDGRLDLAAAGFETDRVAVFFQDEGGRLPPQPDLLLGDASTTPEPNAIAVHDLDGDGLLDLVVGLLGADAAAVFHQSAPRTFPAAPDLLVGGPGVTDAPRDVVAADLDNDGDGDLALACAGLDRIAVFLRDGAGQYPVQPSIVLGDGPVTSGPVALASADFDGDGRIDLACANAGGNDLALFLQAGGAFARQPDQVLGDAATTPGPLGLVAADLDDDGRPDLVAANGVGDTLAVFLQLPAGGFDPLPSSTLGGQGMQSPRSVCAIDLDGDGRVDLASANAVSDNLALFLQDAAGDFGASFDLLLGGTAESAGAERVIAADWNADGRVDLLAANDTTGDLVRFEQDAPGAFAGARPTSLGGPASTLAPAAVELGDWNGDGLDDVACANADGNDVTVFFQSSPGVFPAAPSRRLGSSALSAPASLVGGDFDGDGRLDLAVASEGNDRVALFLRNAQGLLPLAPLNLGGAASTPGVRSLAAGDLDGDGRLDLAAAVPGLDAVVVFLQDASGALPTTPSLVLGDPSTTPAPLAVVAADWSADGRVDLAAIGADGSVALFVQDAGGGLPATPARRLSGLADPAAIAAGDWNADGRPDLAVLERGADRAALFLQLPGGGFPAAPDRFVGDSALTPRPTALCALDADGDGLDDLAIASGDRERLVLFRQVAPGRFGSVPVADLGDPTTLGEPVALDAADVDGDGEVDLVGAATLRAFVYPAGR